MSEALSCFNVKYCCAWDCQIWCLPVTFDALRDCISNIEGHSDVVGNAVLESEVQISSPAIYVDSLLSSYPNMAFMWSVVHLMLKLFMYQETFEANTWDLWSDEDSMDEDSCHQLLCTIYKDIRCSSISELHSWESIRW